MTTVQFDPGQVQFNEANGVYQYPGTESFQVGPELMFPGVTYLIQLAPDESITMLSVRAELDTSTLATFSESDITTSSENRYSEINRLVPSDQKLGRSSVYLADNLTVGDVRYARLILFPVLVDSDGEIKAVREISIDLNGRWLTEADLLDPGPITDAIEKSRSLSPLSAGVEYLVVTSQSLAEAYQRLVDYKNAIGLTTKLALVEDILASYSGRDDAEKLREHLKEFYAEGGRYVLLGGDETVVPIRYAYHYRTTSDLAINYLQVSDLYFADVDGDWNADGDNVWGERYDDDADLTHELLVGRLPLSDSTEVSNYISKLIAYETDPGGGNLDWLTRAYFYSSDQMRDYQGIGQHNMIGASYPAWFELDTINGVESLSGIDPAPTNALPLETVRQLSTGYGVVNIIAHGRVDGFVVKSSEYNKWPKDYLLTAPQSGAHSSTDSIAQNGLTGFYYSLACDNGGFDLERINHTSPVLVHGLLGRAEAGAVGFIAYSRWGWVGSSHYLQRDFFDSLFANPDRPAIESFYAVKEQYYYMRDLVLGQNYYGDPTMKVYTDRPELTNITVSKSGNNFTAVVTSNGSPLDNTAVLLSQNGSLVAEYLTDSQGEALLLGLTEPDETYQIAVVKPGHTIGLYNYAPSIVTGVEDDEPSLPGSFRLGQNYPNPFNPSTVIPFELAHSGRANVTLFNILGQAVVTLLDRYLPTGSHEVVWDGRDQNGQRVASGVYLYQLKTETVTAVKKMLLLE